MTKMNEILVAEGAGGDVFFATGIGMVANMPSPRRKPILLEEAHYSEGITPWGDDNLKPQRTIEQIETNDTLPAVIEFKVKALMSGGLMYGEIYYDENGDERYRPMRISEVDDFLSETEHDNYLHESALDYYTHANSFTGFSKNLAGKIVDLYSIDAAQCRLGAQVRTGRRKGMFDEVLVHGDWASAVIDETERYAALDPYHRVVRQMRETPKTQFVLPVRYQTRGRLDYAKGPVDFLIASGWLEISKQIPIWKKSVMENQLSIKYHLEVEPKYWGKRFTDWHQYDPKKQSEIKKETYAEFIKFFKGTQKAGNVLITNYHMDTGGTEWSEWKVTVLKGENWGDGSYMEESVSSDAHIIRALGVDHTLINLTPGTGYTSGSGSDKRVAFNQHVLMTQPEQRRILRPFDYIAEINDWHKYVPGDGRLRFWFKNTFIATLDHGKETKSANENDNRKT